MKQFTSVEIVNLVKSLNTTLNNDGVVRRDKETYEVGLQVNMKQSEYLIEGNNNVTKYATRKRTRE